MFGAKSKDIQECTIVSVVTIQGHGDEDDDNDDDDDDDVDGDVSKIDVKN